ncbi:MAG: radical SAM family heme chaperone HemW [Lachnospiraceae bacterium]|nr:radical SAM family heme chaperone HemW [Lachnospiraceae bacterium]MDY5741650.1 radical SAM family heme chaperone HemW [Lachnospiraceae bacterium]
MKQFKRRGIYVHIPFCVRKCEYCDFLSMTAVRRERQAYAQALTAQLQLYARDTRDMVFDTLYIGGGTPSVLESELMEPILWLLQTQFRWRPEAEKSIEVNPGSIEPEKARLYRQFGLNRISMGAQSMQAEELKLLGRIHTAGQVAESVHVIREAGFTNINIDLMYALPGQTIDSFFESVRQIIALEPQHISAYSLIIEEGTPFFGLYAADELARRQGRRPQQLPNEDEEREMAKQVVAWLAKAGYRQYEVSNFAKPGYHCRHNVDCWQLQEYLGIGLGAAGFWQGRRFRQPTDWQTYLSRAGLVGPGEVADWEACSKKSLQEEFMFLGLRLTDGVSGSEFAERFGESLHAVYGRVIERLMRKGLLEERCGRLRLTAAGHDISSFVLTDFLQD